MPVASAYWVPALPCSLLCLILQELKSEPEPEPEPLTDVAPVTNNQPEPSSGDLETDKKIKNLKKVKMDLRVT